MRPLTLLSSTCMVLLFVGLCLLAASAKRKTELVGQIIAYRPADRISQVASHVMNKENFLFKLGRPRSHSDLTVVKVVYEHLGFSDMNEQLLNDMPDLKLKASRDTACDESYSAFVADSPVITGESGRVITDRIIFLGRFRNIKIPPERILECYVMEKGDFQTYNTTSDLK